MSPESENPSGSYELHIPVPVAELDPYGELKVTAQIGLLQLAAARATAASGFDGRWYDENGLTWVVRYTHIERSTPALHDDELLIRTWVSDFRRVRSWRHYEIRRASDGALLASAKTDWVFVDTATNGPAAIPEEIQKAFMPRGVMTEPRPKRLRFPGDAEPLSLRRVEWADLDALGHVNNSTYAGFIEQAVLEQLAAGGWEPKVAIASPRLRLDALEIEYLTPALFRHQLSAKVALTRESDRVIRGVIEILTDDQPSVRAVGSWRWSEKLLPADLDNALRPTA